MNKKRKLILLSFGHLLIDLTGIYIINFQYNHLGFVNIALYFIIYNVIAFGIQPVVGYFADEYVLYKEYIVIGLLFGLVGILTINLGLLAIFTITIGNALYHVGGGVLSLDLYPAKAMPAGVFVAPGAIGVFCGYLLSQNEYDLKYLMSIVIVLMIMILFKFYKKNTLKSTINKIPNNLFVIVSLIITVIAVRGFVGSVLVFEWKDNHLLQGLLVGTIFFGKFLGGFLGDRFGFKEVGVTGLILSMPLLLVGKLFIVFGLLGAFFFNLTMAITLFVLIDSMGKYKGFAFGLTTLTLVIFFLPSQLGFSLPNGTWYYLIIGITILIAAVSLFSAIKQYNKNILKEDNVCIY